MFGIIGLVFAAILLGVAFWIGYNTGYNKGVIEENRRYTCATRQIDLWKEY